MNFTFVSILMILSGISVEAFGVSRARPTVPNSKDYILCSRDSEIRAIDSILEQPEKDPCTGTTKIQGISYKCGQVSEYYEKTREFLTELQTKGKERCNEICRNRAPRCRGIFTEPTKCGFSVPAHEALEFGKNQAPCNPECGGQAFIYCSIYHASFLRIDETMFGDKAPNCKCVRY